jgi:hypothetical protein
MSRFAASLAEWALYERSTDSAKIQPLAGQRCQILDRAVNLVNDVVGRIRTALPDIGRYFINVDERFRCGDRRFLRATGRKLPSR